MLLTDPGKYPAKGDVGCFSEKSVTGKFGFAKHWRSETAEKTAYLPGCFKGCREGVLQLVYLF